LLERVDNEMAFEAALEKWREAVARAAVVDVAM
jgi:hypothetical protein